MNEYTRALNTMGESGIYWIDVLFKWCVIFLVDLANVLGVTYEEINIYLFVFLLPLLLSSSVILNIYLLARKQPC